MRKKRKRKTGSWQLLKLSCFAQEEQIEIEFYEMYYRTISFHIPLRILTVILFFQKEEYTRKPGSLVALYRVSKGTEKPILDFLERFEKYYMVLEKEGCL